MAAPSDTVSTAAPSAGAERLAQMSARTSLAVMQLDADMRVLEWNAGAERLFGYRREEILGVAALELLVPPEAREHVRAIVDQVRGRDEALSTNVNLRKDGTRVICDWYNVPLLDSQGRFMGLSCVAADMSARVSAQQALAEERERIARALDGARISLWDTDISANEIQLDGHWSEMLGGPPVPTRASVSDLMELVHPEDLPGIRSALTDTLTGRKPDYVVEQRVKTLAGGWLWIESRGRVVERDPGGRASRMSGSNADVSARKRSEERLRELLDELAASESRFRRLAALSADFYWEQDAELRFTYFSEGAERSLGTPSASILGLRRWDLPTRGVSAAQWEAHRITLRARRPFHGFEYERVNALGESVWMSVSGEPTFDATGTFTGYHGVSSNVTARKRAQRALAESEARFRSLTALSSDWYWEQDASFRFVQLSGGVAATAGSSATSHIGMTRRELPGAQASEAQWTAHGALLDAHEAFRDFEYQRISEKGEQIWLSVSGEPIFDAAGRFTGYRGIGRNITERKRLEQAKDEFVAVMSHELKTPLAAIVAAVSMLGDELDDNASSDARRFAEIARTNAERLTRLINDVLDIGRLESGLMRFAPAPADLCAVAGEVVAAFEPHAVAAGLRVGLVREVRQAPSMVDADRVGQALGSLLYNAAKYAPAGSEITLAVLERPGGWRLVVADAGPGVPAQFVPQLFQKFAQADASDRRARGGAGLGLAIARGIVEASGGRIGYERPQGGPTQFYIEFPGG